ncbi:MAG: penicillin-binding protein 2 [Phycisphaerae bacterium]|nr:penicillin-binding protein 2 [Phycisphaerae bacterium]
MTHRGVGRWRFDLIFGLLLLSMGVLAYYLGWMVRRGRADEIRRARKCQRLVRPRPARPGSIFARTRNRYVLMAGSRRVPCAFVDPKVLAEEGFDGVAIGVGEALDLDPIELQDIFFSRRGDRYVVVKRDITAGEVEAVRALGLRSVGIAYEWWREYPNGSLAATVLGFRRRDNVAGGGLELSQDEHLAPVNGLQVSLGDVRRRPVWPVAEKSVTPSDGNNVFLCLDAVIQGYLQRAVTESAQRFSAKWATGVVVDPNTGQILAMCSAPTFDPNIYNRSQPNQQVNRAISVPYEPGSAAKWLFAAAAVDAGVMTYQTRIFCENGSYHPRNGGRISDHGKRYGYLTLREVMVVSSNIGMAKTGEVLGNRRLWVAARRFGLGEKSGIWLPGESRGVVHPLRQWNGYSMRRVPFGQEVSTTALQLAMAFSSLANGGLLVKPRIIGHIRGPDGEITWRSRREVVRRVLSPSVAAESLSVLQDVVERGTGKACRMARWTSFGKTGTAEIAGPTGYIEGAYTATFVGGAPASSPKVICLISVYWPDKSRGYYGGTVAAPQVKRVLERTLWYMGVPPDRPVNLAWAG